MWGDLDFSRLQVSFELEDLKITVLNAKRTAFFDGFPNHMHGFYELHYIFAGEGTLLCQDGRHPLHSGILYLNGPNVYHEQLTSKENMMMEYSFSFDIKPLSHPVHRGSSLPTDRLKAMKLWIGEDRNEIGEIFRKIEKEIQEKETGYFSVIRNLCELLLIKVIRNFTASETKQHDGTGLQNSTEDRRKFIMDEAFIYNYRDMDLSTLAKMLNLSERQTIRNIRQFYGMSFSEFRQNSRMNAAAQLLQTERSMGIADVAEQVGFSSEAHFRQLFKERYGMTPTNYRKKHFEIT